MDKGFFLHSTASGPALRPIQPSTHPIHSVLSPVVKRPGREANHSPITSSEVKNNGAIPPREVYKRDSLRLYICACYSSSISNAQISHHLILKRTTLPPLRTQNGQISHYFNLKRSNIPPLHSLTFCLLAFCSQTHSLLLTRPRPFSRSDRLQTKYRPG
jgi:hypothetical protein